MEKKEEEADGKAKENLILPSLPYFLTGKQTSLKTNFAIDFSSSLKKTLILPPLSLPVYRLEPKVPPGSIIVR